MNNQTNVLKILKEIYKNNDESFPLYLEGGALCCLFWEVDREFSGDIDFTTSFENIDIVMKHYSQKLENENFAKLVRKNENEYEAIMGDGSVVKIDIYYAPKENCEYSELELDGVKIKCHSMQDMLAEKACCMMTRDKVNDKLDFEYLVKNKQVDWGKFAELLKKKIKVKKILDL